MHIVFICHHQSIKGHFLPVALLQIFFPSILLKVAILNLLSTTNLRRLFQIKLFHTTLFRGGSIFTLQQILCISHMLLHSFVHLVLRGYSDHLDHSTIFITRVVDKFQISARVSLISVTSPDGAAQSSLAAFTPSKVPKLFNLFNFYPTSDYNKQHLSKFPVQNC